MIEYSSLKDLVTKVDRAREFLSDYKVNLLTDKDLNPVEVDRKLKDNSLQVIAYNEFNIMIKEHGNEDGFFIEKDITDILASNIPKDKVSGPENMVKKFYIGLMYLISLEKIVEKYKIDLQEKRWGLEEGKLYNLTEAQSEYNLINIGNGYPLYLSLFYLENPFVINSNIVRIGNKLNAESRTNLDQTKRIFNWMQRNIHYDYSKERKGYRNSVEVFNQKKGVCGEQAYLYVTMVRCSGSKSNWVNVDIDNKGEEVDHSCAAIFDKGKMILVDTAYHEFNINHKSYDLYSDEEVVKEFKFIRKKDI